MRYARIVVSAELLRQALSLPSGTVVRAVAMTTFPDLDIEMVVEHEGLRDLREGDAIPLATPTFAKKDGPPAVFCDWGQ
jgi:hypothetical protein